LPELEGESAVGHGIQIDLKEIDVKLAIDVMEFVLVAFGLRQIGRKLFEVITVIGATLVHAFMNNKMFSVFLGL